MNEEYAAMQLNLNDESALTMEIVKMLRPDDVCLLFDILGEDFSDCEIAHLLALVSQQVTDRAHGKHRLAIGP